MTITADTRAPTPAATTMPIDDITIHPSYRRLHLGRLRDLQQSIALNGLLRPVAVAADGHLIAGERRLRAVRNLGWTDIAVTVATDNTHAVQLIAAEHDNEGPCHKAQSATELTLLGLHIEDFERSSAEARRAAGQRGQHAEVRRQSRDVAADTVGMSRHYYVQIRAVVLAWLGYETQAGGYERVAVDPEWSVYSRTVLNDIDQVLAGVHIEYDAPSGRRTRLTVNAVYERWSTERSRRRVVVENNSYSTNEAAPVRHRAQRESLLKGLASLNGLCNGLAAITEIDPAVTSEEAAALDRDLSHASQVLRGLRLKIKEYANGNA
jgi:hypothetical protein